MFILRSLIVILFLLFYFHSAFSYPLYPTVKGSLCNPTDKDFLGFRYVEKIPVCKRNVSTQLKIKVCARDGVFNRKDFTVDHYISLFAGGSNKEDNLWCQHKSIYSGNFEYQVYLELRDGVIAQKDAIQKLKDWKANPIITP